MNLKKRKQASQLKSAVINNILPEANKGSVSSNDNTIYLNTNGVFKILQISYKGEPFISNILPDGFGINMNSSKIIIINYLNKTLDDNFPILTFSGELSMSSASIYNLKGKVVNLNVVNYIDEDLIEKTNTKFEDNSIILIQETIQPKTKFATGNSKRGIDSKVVKGLYRSNKLPNGYSGNYSYDPDNKLFISGKNINEKSEIINNIQSRNLSPKRRRIVNNYISKATKELNKPRLSSPSLDKNARSSVFNKIKGNKSLPNVTKKATYATKAQAIDYKQETKITKKKGKGKY
tara:strand:+ start:330 stop:1205 length:876 start_codon:yes stop_codon:yes gene_type:complete